MVKSEHNANNDSAASTVPLKATSPALQPPSRTSSLAEEERRRTEVSSVAAAPLQRANVSVMAGMFSGVCQAGLFVPYDRALYISVLEHRPFLKRENFTHPYHGFMQTVGQRTVQSGLYFVLQGALSDFMTPHLRALGCGDTLTSFLLGSSAGLINGALLNPVAATKYHSWTMPGSTFLHSASNMWRMGGIRPFVKGVVTTASRDMIFGSVYEVVRALLLNSTDRREAPYAYFVVNMVAGAAGTILSGPFNYVRVVQYGTPPGNAYPTQMAVLRMLYADIGAEMRAGGVTRGLGLLQQRLRIGWGTARVGIGMAVGQHLFDWANRAANEFIVTR